MSSRKASELASEFRKRLERLDETRNRIELAHAAKHLRIVDVEAAYAGLFLQVIVAYESTLEAFVLGLLVRPGGLVSADPNVRGSVRVRTFAHALKLTAGPNARYASWISKDDIQGIAALVLNRGLPFHTQGIDWHYVHQCRYIRNAIAHPSNHAHEQFRTKVLGNTPLPWRERTVAGYLRGRGTGTAQTRWEVFAAGLQGFVQGMIA